MKKHIWSAFSYTCISYTTVSTIFAVAGWMKLLGPVSGIGNPALLRVCAVLAPTQVCATGSPP